MVSLRQKRCSNVYDDDITTDDSDYEYTDTRNTQQNKNNGKLVYSSSKLNPNSMSIKKAKLSYPFSSPEYENMSQTGRRQRCFSKNALMARENRIKKKIYVQDLEETVEKFRDENKKLSSILDNQSTVITDLRKELKYLKNVLANSTDIGRLLKCINQNTGMPVATSINNNIKFAAPISNKKHPWAEEKLQLDEINNIEFDEINGEFTTLLPDFENDSKMDDLFSDFTPSFGNEEVSLPDVPLAAHEHLDHNYTNSFLKNIDEDVGVCLHIAKHKVSLEFCSSCSENATTAWNED